MSGLKIVGILSENGFSQNSYLIVGGNSLVLVDCGCTKEAFFRAMRDNNCEGRKLDCIVLTHTHFDHITGLFDIWNEYKCDVYIANDCEDFIYDRVKNASAYFGGFVSKPIYKECIKSVSDNEKINIGDIVIEAYSTEGHSLCSMCYKVGNNLFTGDTILQGTIGRTDLYGSSRSELQRSLLKIKRIPFEWALPGHGERMDRSLVNGIINFYTN